MYLQDSYLVLCLLNIDHLHFQMYQLDSYLVLCLLNIDHLHFQMYLQDIPRAAAVQFDLLEPVLALDREPVLE